VSGLRAVTKSSEITGDFYPRDSVLLYEIIEQLYFLPSINSSLDRHTFDIIKFEPLILSRYNTNTMYLPMPTVVTLHKQSDPVDT